MTFMSVVFLFPATPQTTVQDMNYSVVVLGGILALSLVWYYFPKYGGVHWFTGPIPTVERTSIGSDVESDLAQDKKANDEMVVQEV